MGRRSSPYLYHKDARLERRINDAAKIHHLNTMVGNIDRIPAVTPPTDPPTLLTVTIPTGSTPGNEVPLPIYTVVDALTVNDSKQPPGQETFGLLDASGAPVSSGGRTLIVRPTFDGLFVWARYEFNLSYKVPSPNEQWTFRVLVGRFLGLGPAEIVFKTYAITADTATSNVEIPVIRTIENIGPDTPVGLALGGIEVQPRIGHDANQNLNIQVNEATWFIRPSAAPPLPPA